MIGDIETTLWIIRMFNDRASADNWAAWQNANKDEAVVLVLARSAADELGYLLLKDLEDAEDKND